MTVFSSITGPTDISVEASSSPTPGATVTLSVTNDLNKQILSWTAAQAETLNISGSHPAGKEIVCVITNDGTLPRVITLGAALIGIGVITGVISKKSIIGFISDGTNFYEQYRTIGI